MTDGAVQLTIVEPGETLVVSVSNPLQLKHPLIVPSLNVKGVYPVAHLVIDVIVSPAPFTVHSVI